ncbi:uncharacterized protein PHALS_02138 [Plasmopara halstedii]|uniref:Uncharacterized protein n=1 Tax=Plasmopara halstedii TaxID=4781 RepID=A0A0P1AVW7_PLAHL|nr:uncharacterized protein PHALS_02138 [Plasmopara halstedii]CEG45865.1 hypothetical protein PHALS_02138 [Plasmopara halstedii]|eukprot:XP_024582234.1 hypothetical protein PHALS_02138 [Plasmopara halstedii]
MFTYMVLPDKSNRQFWSTDLWCLVDSLDPTSIPALPYRHCSVFLASTPRRDCIGEFKKLFSTPDVFYVPLWSKDELGTIAPLYPFAGATWQNQFECLDGAPRVVLQDIGMDPQTLLMSACNSCSLDDCITLVSICSDVNLKTLIHMRSQEPYRKCEVAYASELAIKVIARTKWRSDRAKVQGLLCSCDGNPLAQSLCGYVFEPYSMDLLEQGGNFVYRKLLSGADMRKRDTNKRNRGNPVNEDEKKLYPTVIAASANSGAGGSRPTCQSAILRWIPDDLGKTHDIKSGAADDLAKLGQKGNRLFFLLPPLYYKTFTKKTPQTIEQYAILVPYPEGVLLQRFRPP